MLRLLNLPTVRQTNGVSHFPFGPNSVWHAIVKEEQHPGSVQYQTSGSKYREHQRGVRYDGHGSKFRGEHA